VRIRELLSRSLMLVTALSPHIGYDRAAEIARRAHVEGITLRDAAIALQVDAEDFDRWVRPDQMVGNSMAGNGAVTLIGGDSTGTS
jgi:fumarate hydratase class II